MNRFRAAVFTVAFLSSLILHSQSRTRKTVTFSKYENGNRRSKTVLKVTTNFYVDLFNYYKQTSLKVITYDSISGKRQKETIRVTKNGMVGKHCYEIYTREILYDQKGRKKRFEETWCDKGERKLKEYQEGKVVFIHIEKRAKRKRSK